MAFQKLTLPIALLALGLPFSLALTYGLLKGIQDKYHQSPHQVVAARFQKQLAEPCYRYRNAQRHSQLEHEAIQDINDILGGQANTVLACSF